MAKDKTKKTTSNKSFKRELTEQLLRLSTSGFGLVAALAWNEAIQSFVSEFVQPFFKGQSGLISKFIYAVIITAFAVLITYQLSRLATRLGHQAQNN